jgi:hypothetical protein
VVEEFFDFRRGGLRTLTVDAFPLEFPPKTTCAWRKRSYNKPYRK